MVVAGHKANRRTQSTSPSLKRNCSDIEVNVNGNSKRHKSSEFEDVTLQNDRRNDIKNLNYIHKFFRRDFKDKLPKLSQEVRYFDNL